MSSTITNVVEIVTQGTVAETGGSSKNVWNVWHYFQNPNQPGPQTAVAVANVFLTSVWANIAAQLSIAWVGSATLCRYLDDVTFPLLAANVPATGSLALPRLSTAEAVVILRRSATRGKNFFQTTRGTIAQRRKSIKDPRSAWSEKRQTQERSLPKTTDAGRLSCRLGMW